MPWSNQSGGGGKRGGGGGPWGNGGGGGPWGQGPSGGGSGGGQQQPDLEEILKRSQDRLKQVMPGSGLPGPLLFLAAIAAAGVFAFYAFFFTVKTDELGVVLRFGKLVRVEPPGLHYRLPYPIEEVRLPKVTRQNQIEVGMRTASSGRGFTTAARDVPEESLMLTGDENIVDIDFVVQWIIVKAEDYLFNIQRPDDTVKDVAESAMREVIGKSKVGDVLAPGREPIEIEVRRLMQEVLDGYGAGVRILQVKIQQAQAPAQVRAAFEDVISALQDRDRAQNEARAYANRVIPEARGEAERIIQAAQAYKEQAVAEARGQTSRFLKVYDEYRKEPDVTRKRLFLETMEKVLGGTDKIILDSKAGSGVVPYLPLGELQRNSGK